MKRHNFTLIELFVVICFLGASAGLFMPALSNARERGRSASCISNLKQIGLCEMLYAGDNSDYRVTPTGFTGEYIGNDIDPIGTQAIKNQFYGNYPASKLILLGYTGNFGILSEESKKMFQCPSDESYSANNVRISYYDAVFSEDKPQAKARHNLNKVQKPGNLAAWFDQHEQLGNAFSNHVQTVNIAYMDGHVMTKQLPVGKVYSIKSQEADGWSILDDK